MTKNALSMYDTPFSDIPFLTIGSIISMPTMPGNQSIIINVVYWAKEAFVLQSLQTKNF